MKKLNLGTAIYSLVVSIIFLIAPVVTVFMGLVTYGDDGSGVVGTDLFFRVLAIVMVVCSILLLMKDKVASLAGKVLVLIAGAIVIIASSIMAFIAGVVGIVGAALLLASNKRFSDLEKNIEVKAENVND